MRLTTLAACALASASAITLEAQHGSYAPTQLAQSQDAKADVMELTLDESLELLYLIYGEEGGYDTEDELIGDVMGLTNAEALRDLIAYFGGEGGDGESDEGDEDEGW